jgi:hypothetical protein
LAEAQFRTIIGIVQFDPREGQAGGKDVRNITVAATGVKDQAIKVGATLWPSHDHIDVAKGDVVIIEGKFSQNKGEKDGAPVTYNNLSVSRIAVLGEADEGRKVAVENAAADEEPAYDEIPF